MFQIFDEYQLYPGAAATKGPPTKGCIAAVAPKGPPTKKCMAAVAPKGPPTKACVVAVAPKGPPTKGCIAAVAPKGCPIKIRKKMYRSSCAQGLPDKHSQKMHSGNLA